MLSEDRISQQDLRVLLDHAPDAIARFDRALRHVYVNEATARANDRPARDFFGKTMEELGHRKDVCDIINGNLRSVFESGEERTCELLFDGPHGATWFQSRMSPEFDPSGEVEFALVISRDISEQRKAESINRESERNAAKTELASRLAHEINNPLAAVVNAIYLLERDSSIGGSAGQMIKLAAENLERVVEISKKLLILYGEPTDGTDSAREDDAAA